MNKKRQVTKTKAIIKAREIIDHLTERELMIVNKLVVDKINFIQKAKSLQAMSDFCVGDTVYFERDHERITGIVKRLNQKTVSIETEDGIGWNVSSRFLKRYIDVN